MVAVSLPVFAFLMGFTFACYCLTGSLGWSRATAAAGCIVRLLDVQRYSDGFTDNAALSVLQVDKSEVRQNGNHHLKVQNQV